eukprot:8978113-Alexandrium_andersonii.AAC.1
MKVRPLGEAWTAASSRWVVAPGNILATGPLGHSKIPKRDLSGPPSWVPWGGAVPLGQRKRSLATELFGPATAAPSGKSNQSSEQLSGQT